MKRHLFRIRISSLFGFRSCIAASTFCSRHAREILAKLTYEDEYPANSYSNRVSLPRPFPKSLRRQSAAGRWLCRWQHRRGVTRSRKPHNRYLQHSKWYLFPPEPRRWQLQHRRRGRHAPCQHRGLQYGHWRWRAFQQYHCRWQHG